MKAKFRPNTEMGRGFCLSIRNTQGAASHVKNSAKEPVSTWFTRVTRLLTIDPLQLRTALGPLSLSVIHHYILFTIYRDY